MTNRATLISDIKATFEGCLALIETKNRDYATTSDAFANFRLSEMVGVSPQRAILVRVADKLARVSNLLDKPNDVKDETIIDTIIDTLNYLAILKSWLEHGQDRN